MLNFRRYSEMMLDSGCVRFSGHYDIELVHARTGLIASTYSFPNLITNTGLEALGTTGLAPSALFDYIGVGSGNTTPANTDAALVSQLFRTNSNQSGAYPAVATVNVAGGYKSYKITRVFTTAQANGVIAEIGGFQSSSDGTMWSRALVKDAGGVTTTITKTSEYELRVTYECRMYFSLGPDTYAATLNGSAATVTRRPYGLDQSGFYGDLTQPVTIQNSSRPDLWKAYTGLIASSPTVVPSGTGYSATLLTIAAYAAGTLASSATVEWNSGAANNTLRSFLFGFYQPTYQHQMSSTFTKTNLQKLVVGVTNTWGRYP